KLGTQGIDQHAGPGIPPALLEYAHQPGLILELDVRENLAQQLVLLLSMEHVGQFEPKTLGKFFYAIPKGGQNGERQPVGSCASCEASSKLGDLVGRNAIAISSGSLTDPRLVIQPSPSGE